MGSGVVPRVCQGVMMAPSRGRVKIYVKLLKRQHIAWWFLLGLLLISVEAGFQVTHGSPGLDKSHCRSRGVCSGNCSRLWGGKIRGIRGKKRPERRVRKSGRNSNLRSGGEYVM